MLLHISPTIFSPRDEARLLTLDIEPFDLHLKGGSDLRTGRPFPNKCYWVACRKAEKKHVKGVLIETPKIIEEFQYTARWLVGPAFVATHRVHYKILDRDFDAVSDNMLLWSGTCKELGDWSSRTPDWAKHFSPMQVQPRMEVMHRGSHRRVLGEDILDEQSGWIFCRQETFSMPTIERERITNSIIEDRLPPVSSRYEV